MNLKTEIMSAEYTKAVKLNQHIKAHAQIAQESLYEVCKGLKEMRDDKLYKELNYQNFEEYCEKEVGIKRHMAYKYANIAEIENVELIQHFGVTKLSLLAKLDEPQREEIQQKVDINAVSVKEFKARIKELQAQNKALTNQRTELEIRINALEQQPRDTVFENAPETVQEIQNLKHAMQTVSHEWAERYDALQEKSLQEQNDLKRAHQQELATLRNQLAEKSEPESGTKELFKAFLTNTIDSMNRLLEFLEENQQDENSSLYLKKTNEFLLSVNADINDLFMIADRRGFFGTFFGNFVNFYNGEFFFRVFRCKFFENRTEKSDKNNSRLQLTK